MKPRGYGAVIGTFHLPLVYASNLLGEQKTAFHESRPFPEAKSANISPKAGAILNPCPFFFFQSNIQRYCPRVNKKILRSIHHFSKQKQYTQNNILANNIPLNPAITQTFSYPLGGPIKKCSSSVIEYMQARISFGD